MASLGAAKSRLGPNQRERLWPVFAAVRMALATERITTWAEVFIGLAEALTSRSFKPFDHVVIDEAQDLAPAELRFFAGWLVEGLAAHEMGIFVRTPALVPRARAAVDGLEGSAAIVTGPMSLAKGLEFRAVVVMACDEGVLPLDERVADAADEAELDDIYETERRLLYVACTRAREHLLLTGVTPASEYLADLVRS